MRLLPPLCHLANDPRRLAVLTRHLLDEVDSVSRLHHRHYAAGGFGRVPTPHLKVV